MNALFRVAIHPEPELERFDTSLRYTDILFGFVIRELFLRLQNWMQLDRAVQLHLIVGTTLVLGSWIGFRRSLYRSSYQVKFFNLPLSRFIADQLMLILYFRVAVLTDATGKVVVAAVDLADSTMRLLVFVFILYTLWISWAFGWQRQRKRERTAKRYRGTLTSATPRILKSPRRNRPRTGGIVNQWNRTWATRCFLVAS